MKRLRHGNARRGAHSKAYEAWHAMCQRCNNPKHAAFADYGGRGITICPEWDSFEQFLTDMGDSPPRLTLDRRDNNKGYSKANCRWATHTEQQQNRRGNVLLTHKGETHCVKEWARILGFGSTTLYDRLALGWSVERALSAPAKPTRNITFQGETRSLSQWARHCGLKVITLYTRLQLGWDVERALTSPVKGR